MTETTALHKYTVRIYELMEKESETNEFGEQIFTGLLTEMFLRSGASTAYYTAARKLLLSPIDNPCIIIEQRGNSSQPSIIRLNHPPPSAWEKSHIGT